MNTEITQEPRVAVMGGGRAIGKLALIEAMSSAMMSIVPPPTIMYRNRRNPPSRGARRRMFHERCHYPQPKNTNNSPDRAKGMQPWDVDGVVIYAGTRKAAAKKARLLSKVAR
jgi:hypothetical protein